MGIRHAELAAGGRELGTGSGQRAAGSGHTVAEVGTYVRCADPVDSGCRMVGFALVISLNRRRTKAKPFGAVPV